MDRRKDGRKEGWKAENYVPPLFFEKAGDNKKPCGDQSRHVETKELHVEKK